MSPSPVAAYAMGLFISPKTIFIGPSFSLQGYALLSILGWDLSLAPDQSQVTTRQNGPAQKGVFVKAIAPFYSAIVLFLVLILAWYNYAPRRRYPARQPTSAGRDHEANGKDGVGSRLVFETKT